MWWKHSKYVEVLNDTEYASTFRFQGNDTDSNYIMCMRRNITHYVEFLNTFSPSMVSLKKWSTFAVMEAACVGQGAFSDMLTVSDEAFMLLLIDNYAVRWYAENERARKKVSHFFKHNH